MTNAAMPDTPITAADLRALRLIAARYAAAHEADDIVQDVLLAAIRAGRACGGERFRRWAHGAIRNHSRFLARSAGRRRARETAHRELADPDGTPRMAIPAETVAALSPALRVVALLANLGIGKAEIAWLLGLSDQTARQRIHALRKAVQRSGAEPEPVEETSTGDEPLGPARRRLKRSIPPRGERRFAIRDPDGMGIFFSAAHIPGNDGNT